MYFVNIFVVFLYMQCIGLYYIACGQGVCSGCRCPYLLEESLDCSSRSISDITNCGLLDNCSPVAVLIFSNNAITQVGNLSSLILQESPTNEECLLDFSSNNIDVFYPTSFDMRCNSLTLDLSFNHFKNLSSNTLNFLGFGYLGYASVTLNLSSNKIEFIEESIIGTIVGEEFRNLTIDLSFNNIVLVPVWVITPRRISYFIGSFIESFTLLMNNNRISSIELDDIVRNVYNRFSTVDFWFFNLQNNNIEGFSRDTFAHLTLDLSGNPWNCDCSQRYVSNNSSNLRANLNLELSKAPLCQDPPFVRRRPLLSLSSEEFICLPKLDPGVELELEINLGQNIELQCPFTGADPQIESVDWEFSRIFSQKDEKASLFRFQSTCANCTIDINNAQEDAAGEYRCTVSNGQSLTITQTLRVLGDVNQGSAAAPSSLGSLSDDEPMVSSRPIPAGIIVVIVLLVVLLFLVSLTLTVVGYNFYKIRSSGESVARTNDKAIAFNIRRRPPSAPKLSVTANQGFDDEEDSYEIPNQDKKNLRRILTI